MTTRRTRGINRHAAFAVLMALTTSSGVFADEHAVASPGQPAPDGQLFVYAKDGVSPEQQMSDRYQCDTWAVEKTGYDPTLEDGGVSADVAPVKRAEYFRAEAACLEARGYSVR